MSKLKKKKKKKGKKKRKKRKIKAPTQLPKRCIIPKKRK